MKSEWFTVCPKWIFMKERWVFNLWAVRLEFAGVCGYEFPIEKHCEIAILANFHYQTAHPCRRFISVIYLFATEMDIACRHVTLDHSQINLRTCPRKRLLTSPRFGDGTRLMMRRIFADPQICIYLNFSCWQHLRNMHESENRMKVFFSAWGAFRYKYTLR